MNYRLTVLPLVCAALSACTSPLTVTPTTGGQQPAAPVTRIEGQVPQRVIDVAAQVGGVRSAGTVTPPAPDANGTVNPSALAAFAVPLPSAPEDAALTRFYDLFSAPSCKQAVTGNLLARLHLLSALDSASGPLVSVSAAQQGNVTTGRTQVAYLYADRATYLRGTVTCPVAGAQQRTGFELNVQAGWNRVVISQGLNGADAGRLYATAPRVSGGNAAPEVWSTAP